MALKLKARKGVLYVMGTYDGVRVRKTTDCVVGEDVAAMAKLTEIKRKIDAGEWETQSPRAMAEAHPATQMTFNDLAQEYLDDPEEYRSEGTIGYVRRLRVVVGPKRLCDFNSKTCDEAMTRLYGPAASRTVTPGSVERTKTVLRAVLNYSQRLDALRGYWVPPKIVVRALDNKREVYLDITQVRAILAWLKENRPHVWPLFIMMVYTGARPVELCRLRWRDVRLHVDVEQCSLLLRSYKGRPRKLRTRVVPMNGLVRDWLRGQFQTDGHVFLSKRGKPWAVPSPAWLDYWQEVREEFQLGDVDAYDLRHTFASWLRQNGRELVDVRDLLGHSSITTTERYAHIGPQRLAQAVTDLPV